MLSQAPRRARFIVSRPVRSARRVRAGRETMNRARTSRSFDDDFRDDLGNSPAGINRLLQPTVQLAHLDERQQVGRVGEQLGFGVAVDAIGLVLQAADLAQADIQLVQVLHLPAELDRLDHVLGALMDDLSHLDHLRRGFLDAKGGEAVGGLLHVVQHIVEGGRQRVDILAVERSDEAAVEGLDDALDNEIAGVLGVLELIRSLLQLVEGRYHVQELLPGIGEDVRDLVKQVEKLFFTGDQKHHRQALLSSFLYEKVIEKTSTSG